MFRPAAHHLHPEVSMRSTMFVIVLSAALAASGCKKIDIHKADESKKTDLQRTAEKLKKDAEKIRDSEALKRAQEKAGEELEKAGEKLKENAEEKKKP
jgi:uncharacterized membrane protein (DUF106 family)